jgi:putative intracellular protease/amidase
MLPILIVTTSHGAIGDTGRPTGLYFEELATPYWAFLEAGFQVEIASIAGGAPPIDPASLDSAPNSVRRFQDDAAASAMLKGTRAVAALNPADYAAVFLPGGHGTMWDLPGNDALIRLVGALFNGGQVVAAVCHGPAGLLQVRQADGRPLVAGRRVSAFTDAEEQAVGLVEAVPFLLETMLREQGAQFEGGPNFEPYAVRDGNLVTGQNPQSSARVAEEIIAALRSATAAGP